MKKIILFHLLFLTLSGLKAQTRDTTYRFSVKQAIEFAMQNQRNVHNAKLDTEIADAQVKEVVGFGLPQINSSFDFKDFEEIPTSLIPGEFFDGEAGTYVPIKFGTQYNATASISATQIIFDPSYLVGVKAAKTVRELANKNLNRTEIETAVDVSKAYYNLLTLIERKKAVDANLVRIGKLLSDTRVMYENGFVEKLDVDRFTVTFNNLTTEQDNFNRLIVLSNKIVKFQMGMDQSAEFIPTETLDAAALKSTVIPVDKFEISQRIEYSILETQRKLQESNVKRYKVGYYPNLIAYGSLSTAAQRDEFNVWDSEQGWYPTGLIGATLSLPIFDGRIKHFKIKQEKLALRKIENNMYRLEEAVSVEIGTAKDALLNAINALNIQEQNLNLSTEIYNTSKLKYDQGVGSNLQLMDAETALTESQANYFNALHDAMISKINLDKALGKIIY